MDEVKLRLVYYFWIPKDDFNEMYELHFKCLEKYSGIFDESSFFIAVNDYSSESLERVKYVENRLIDCGFVRNVTFNVVKNNDCFREGKIFKEKIVDNLEKLDGLTFFGHTKGVTTYHFNVESNKIWVAAMYYFNLSFMEEVKHYLCKCLENSYGFFRSYDLDFYTHIKNRWMYCGTFMWLNCPKICHYIESNGVDVPKLYDRGFAEDFIGNVTKWTNSSSKGGWVTKNQDMYNKCKDIMNLYVKDENELNKFYRFFENIQQ